MAWVESRQHSRFVSAHQIAKTHLRPQLIHRPLIRANLLEPQHQLGKGTSKDRSGVEVSSQDQRAQWRLSGSLDDFEVGLLGGREDGFGGVGAVGEDAGGGGGCGCGLGDEGVGFGVGGFGFGGVE